MSENTLTDFLKEELTNRIVYWIRFYYKQLNTVFDFNLNEVFKDAEKDETFKYLYKIKIHPITNFKSENIKVVLYFCDKLHHAEIKEHIFECSADNVKLINQNKNIWYEILYEKFCSKLNINKGDHFFVSKDTFSVNMVSGYGEALGKNFYNIYFFENFVPENNIEIKIGGIDFYIKKKGSIMFRFGKSLIEHIIFNLDIDTTRLLKDSFLIKNKIFKSLHEIQEDGEEVIEKARKNILKVNEIISQFSDEDKLLFEVNK